MAGVCGFVPYPNSGAYGHWTCQRERHHLGRHRFNNYTIGRIPRVWRLRRLWGAFQADRRIKGINALSRDNKLAGYGYRRTLFPAKYDIDRTQKVAI